MNQAAVVFTKEELQRKKSKRAHGQTNEPRYDRPRTATRTGGLPALEAFQPETLGEGVCFCWWCTNEDLLRL